MKLKLLSMHKIENVPDHVLEEMHEFSYNLTQSILPVVNSVSPNVALSGLMWVHAVMIKHLVTEDPDELRKAAEFSCRMLLSNMEILISKFSDKEKSE